MTTDQSVPPPAIAARLATARDRIAETDVAIRDTEAALAGIDRRLAAMVNAAPVLNDVDELLFGPVGGEWLADCVDWAALVEQRRAVVGRLERLRRQRDKHQRTHDGTQSAVEELEAHQRHPAHRAIAAAALKALAALVSAHDRERLHFAQVSPLGPSRPVVPAAFGGMVEGVPRWCSPLGRHLQQLAAEGYGDLIAQVPELAEFTSPADAPTPSWVRT